VKQHGDKLSGRARIMLFICGIADLSSMTEVRNLSKEIHSKFNKIDVLINNAGLITRQRHSTVDGYEYQFAVNYLSNFLLVHLLLDLLLKSAPSRIINVSSGVHRSADIKFDDLQSEKIITLIRFTG
jgi:NAD(P)-dependent dehydrogenase (short-subunit alcohol dehydrogenase family)